MLELCSARGFSVGAMQPVLCNWELRLVCTWSRQGLVDVIETIKAGRSGEELDPCIERLQNLHVVSFSVTLNRLVNHFLITESQLIYNDPDG